MNRLIIIGNGFDLAHGLPTSYEDFIIGYFRKCLEKGQVNLANTSNQIRYEDDNISFHLPYSWINRLDTSSLSSFTASFFTISNETTVANFFYKNSLLKNVISNSSIDRWIDIESYYYSILKSQLFERGYNKGNIEKLNSEFQRIQDELENYLEELVRTYQIKQSLDIDHIINSQINGDDIYPKTEKNQEVENTLILNLNYTSTIRKYRIKTDSQIIDIHGQTKDMSNPIIFGFGDELDSDYPKIENLNEKEPLRFIKSFKYLQTSNYRDLISFVDSNHFQVFTIGHSIGLSDRTMLNYIFESDNCKSIKIFYHKDKQDFINKTYEVSRHFTNKANMRNLIVSFDRSKPLPQGSSSRIR